VEHPSLARDFSDDVSRVSLNDKSRGNPKHNLQQQRAWLFVAAWIRKKSSVGFIPGARDTSLTNKTINNPVYSKDISLVGLLKFSFFLNSSIGPYCQVLSAPHNGPFHPLVINPIPVDPPFLHPKTSE
jgi:hypothetical protein